MVGRTWRGVLTPGYFEPWNFPTSSIFRIQWWDGRRQTFPFQNGESEKEGKPTNQPTQGHWQVWKPTRANSIWFLRLETNSLWFDAFRPRSTSMVVPPSRCTGLAVLISGNIGGSPAFWNQGGNSLTPWACAHSVRSTSANLWITSGVIYLSHFLKDKTWPQLDTCIVHSLKAQKSVFLYSIPDLSPQLPKLGVFLLVQPHFYFCLLPTC